MKAQEIADIVNSVHDKMALVNTDFLVKKIEEYRGENGSVRLDEYLAAMLVSLRDFSADLVIYSLIALLADDAADFETPLLPR